MKRLLPFLFLLLTFSSLAQKRPMSIVDMLNIPTLGSAELAPNGSQFVYVMAEGDWKQNKMVGHIAPTSAEFTPSLCLNQSLS